ncbi:hypothetical protein ABBQ32_000206 [Trebouxia sp. C0010 RCD-2024]
MSDAKGTARWWRFLEVLHKTDPVSEGTIAVQLRCLLCQPELSASNESRIATSHLRNAGYSKVKASPDLALAVLAAFGKAADNAAPESTPDATDEEALQQLDKKRRANHPLIKDVYLSQEKQEDLTMALHGFFLERSDCVATPEPHGELAGPLLDNRYAETVKQVDDRLAKQSVGVQMATDGWKRKNVNEAQKIQNFIANVADGGTQFLIAYSTEAHGFSLLIKDLLSELAAVGKTSDTTIKISNFSGNHAWFCQLLHDFQKEVYGHTSELVSQVETRFGTEVMVTQSVISSAEALHKTVWNERYADKAAGVEFGQETATLESVLLKRFNMCYHPAMSAAYLCDPAYYTYDADSQAYLANAKQVAEFEAHLHIDVWKDAKQNALTLQVMTRIAGRPRSGKVTIEMTMWQVNGLQELETGSELVKKTLSGTLGRSVFDMAL